MGNTQVTPPPAFLSGAEVVLWLAFGALLALAIYATIVYLTAPDYVHELYEKDEKK